VAFPRTTKMEPVPPSLTKRHDTARTPRDTGPCVATNACLSGVVLQQGIHAFHASKKSTPDPGAMCQTCCCERTRGP